jgi:hypothetical protein
MPQELLEQQENVTPNQDEDFVQKYLKEHFPLQVGEYKVVYNKVGENNFRINFYKKTNPEKIFTDVRIPRSYYVVISIGDKGEISHKVL